MLSLLFLLLLASADISIAFRSHQRRGQSPRVIKHGAFSGKPIQHTNGQTYNSPINRRQETSSGGCSSSKELPIKAPKVNIFAGLSDEEAIAVTAFLHTQKSLNLTASATATPWDNKVLEVNLLQPNKSDALAYLESSAAAPDRHARVLIRVGATLEPYLQEYQVGPLPVANGSTTLAELNYIYNKGKGYQRLYDIDTEELATFTYEVGAKVADITKLLLSGSAVGAANDTLAVAGNTPLIHQDDKIFQWNEFFALHTGPCIDEDLLPTGLLFEADITGRDPSKWAVVSWFYNGIFYESEMAFRQAINSSSFVKPGPNVDGAWACTDWNNVTLPHDELSPPVPVQPDGPRFAVDEEEQYVEWMDFSFYLSSNRDYGIQLHNIKFKGERIIYELGLQEALAHYASSSDPLQGSNAYLDSEYGFGQSAYQLVSGFDCPAYATYWNSSYYTGETTHTRPSSICMFEFDTGYPIQRHTVPIYVTVTKNIAFTVRQISTVGNYDYIFDYEFFMDGSIHVTVRASGYIESSFWTTNQGSQDGFHIHDHLGGAMHDHVLNYKVDLDVAGTANSVMKSNLVPITRETSWSRGRKLNTMTLEKTFIDNEDDGKLNWDANNEVMYSVVNKDELNPYGEYRSYKIQSGTGKRNYLTIQNSTTLGNSVNWATHHLYAVKRKDTEPHSAYPYNGRDPNVPVVDFAKFFDGESLDQEDIVLYFNLGMHHIPDQSDLPNTVTTNAQSSMIIAPQNWQMGDPSRATIHQARINYVNASVTSALTFGTKQPTCSLDLSRTSPNLQSFVGEIYIEKYPYHPPTAQELGDPTAGTAGGFPG